MGATRLSGPLYVGGVPIFGSGGLLATSGAKAFFVDPELGSDANSGEESEAPLATLLAAYNKCTSGRGDFVILKGGPTSGGTTGHTARLSASLTWAKNNTHLIGVCAPTNIAQRARITGPSSGGTFSPLITVSGNGCRFENISFFDDYTVDPIVMTITGQRNYFGNVHFGGMGAATGGDDAAACSVFLNGGDENLFEGCTLGLDTVARSTTNSELKLEGGATRNVFRKCLFVSFCDNAGHLFVKIDGSGDMDRFVLFDDCQFYNAVESTSTTMTQAMDVHNTCGGMVMLKNCSLIGATDWAAADNGNVFIDGTAATAGSDGIMLAVTR